ncbi:glycosyl hydrolase family 18 protein [Reichenbachiella ulvae]|uniref:chitinase n=1 Tax=Reichenbachiella ulvae TaxID=2980104 RepID=A0ABT3CYJ3_9BACT|nr:glycosyl hydrolase family 18 protein [Reichenbachiella ulvae]MCV9388767.1 glycosyl hydrolase family 18 protein [Reichenbachiella ulvae]
MNKKMLVLWILILISTGTTWCQSPSRVVGYLPSWENFSQAIESTDFDHYSHIMVAFANPDMQGDFSINATNDAEISKLITEAHKAGCRVLMSIGGGSTTINEAWEENLKADKRNVLINNLVEFMSLKGFDGVDVDLEGDLVLSEYYDEFVRELDEKLPESKLLTAAMATWSATGLKPETLDRYDFIAVMSYDQTGPWNASIPGQHSSYEKAENDLDYWINTKGVDRDRVVLGLPFYGYNFVSTTNVYSMGYKEIVSQYEGAEESDQIENIYYNGQKTIKAKSELALEKAGGVMIWQILQDVDYSDDRSLLKTIHSVISPVHEVILSSLSVEADSIYPNPCSKYLILPEVEEGDSIKVLSPDGQLVATYPVESGKKIKIEGLPAGWYYLIWESDGKKVGKRFLKK